MIGLGLSAANQLAFHTLLTSSHFIKITVDILDLNHKRLSSVTEMFQDGQITIDATAEITRSANVTFFDPQHKMGLDSTSPADGALYVDRMLAIYYTIYSPTNTGQVTVPVFCGPITKVDRDWSVVQVECQGKESLSQRNTWSPITYKKGAYKTTVIRDLLQRHTGETRFSIPSGITSKLPSNLAMSNDSKPWELAKSLAKGLGYQLFYDGRGTCVMRAYPRATAWTYKDSGAGFSILSKPQAGYDLSNLVNAVIIKGVLIKGKKNTPLVVKRYAPSSHPLSPWAIGRGGVGRYLYEIIEDDTINSVAEANSVGDARIARGLLVTTTVSFDCLPIPHLEENDICRVQTDQFSTTVSVQKMVIPLTADAKGTFGYLRVAAPNKKNIRRNRP